MGPQVVYRSTTASDAVHSGSLPLPLPGENRDDTITVIESSTVSNVQIILPLIDANMVADPVWREWLVRLGRQSPAYHREIIPVALDATAFNVPTPIRELNFLRPAGLPLPTAEESVVALAREQVIRSLLKQLTEALCRFMLGGWKPTNDRAPGKAKTADAVSKVKVFLSHAKEDGKEPARRLRDYIYSQTQLAAFYDENDIAYGSVFAGVLENGIGPQESAALIVVRSARYAARPWCRRELSLFRQPRRVPPTPGGGERWQLYPTLVVDDLEEGKQTSGIPELGNSNCLRWGDGVRDQEEQIVTTLLRDVMLASFHDAMGASIDAQDHQIIINWLPDPTTLLQIKRVRDAASDLDIIHPGGGLSGLELDTLADFFPRLTFHSFEEILS